ncbi:vitamin K epoxide reductase family protein [Arthrobacter burdickii]|uniref:Vitamin K epoxide reductase family protein n=1 Tax=Arthrobacter burdickii TaxID=3035920 RepID=A0ABT8JWS2_9MICC|nr:vitamin K epoxide reductase family protein [Arthrobacter burdickii]MDN4609307.1 vitamin K epoxide reductase family protein [Arthrobacter burdickii]
MAHTTSEAGSAPHTLQDDVSAVPGFARRVPFGIMLVATGVIGWVAAGILILEKLELYRDPDHVTSCDINPWVSCGQVMETWQSELFGFPNPFIGLVGFTIIVTTGMALLAGARFDRWYWAGLQIGVTLGAVFATWLWSQALFDIYILCLYCMVVWAAMIPLFILTTVRTMVHGVIPAPAVLTRWLAEWVGPIIVLTYIAVAASVFFRFLHVFT